MRNYNKEYYRKNSEAICKRQREYYRIKKEKIKKYLEDKDNSVEMPNEVINFFEDLLRREYEKHVNKCRKCLTVYAYKSMQKVKQAYARNVEVYYQKYPFDKHIEKYIKGELFKLGIFANSGEYSDCYDSGMLAYLYSIHRCAALNCDYVLFYIKKMIRIYVCCARTVYRDSHNFCRINKCKEVRIDDAYNI